MRRQSVLARLSQSLGVTQLAAGSVSFVGQDVVAYVSGFYVVFYNFARRQTVGQV